MIPLRSADKAPAPFNVRALSHSRFDWKWLEGHFERMPERFRPVVGREYLARRKPAPGEWRTSIAEAEANTWLREEVAPRLKPGAVKLADSDSEICAAALACAEDCASFLSALVLSDRAAVVRQLTGYMERQGVQPPTCELPGLIARATDAAWWRRQLRKSAGRSVEQLARELGLVHRRAGLYASDETVARHQEQGRRNAAALENTLAENELGQAYTLAELAELGLSNPDVRRADLMVRIRGFEEWARGRGDVGVFVTWTAPSCYHARLSATGAKNPKYQEGTTPREAHALVSAQWAKCRAKLHRAGVVPYGFRVVEPHHDGTPHWHMLFFVKPAARKLLVDTLAAYAWEPEPQELNNEPARRARFECKAIDWRRGTAAGYIAKYIAKNINGQKAGGESIGEDFEGGEATETSARVRAWASCWGIRQFQPIGGPGVTAWRELRKLRATPEGTAPAQVAEQGELFAQAWSAADRGDWAGYIQAQGGIEIKRDERPVQLWRESPETVNRYWEAAAPVVRGVAYYGATVQTRLHTWQIKRKPEGFEVGRKAQPSAPWTRVNNCTEGLGNEGFAGAEGHQGGPSGSQRGPLDAQGGQGGFPRGGFGGVGMLHGVPRPPA